MNLRTISIRSRFLLLIVCSVLFWLLAGFIVLSLADNLSRYQDISRDIGSLPHKILRLENSVHSFYLNDLWSESFHESGRSGAFGRFEGTYLDCYTLLRDLENNSLLADDPLIQQKIDHLLEYLNNTDSYIETLGDKSRARGWQDHGLSGTLIEQLDDPDLVVLPGFELQAADMAGELEMYLASPGSNRLNALLSSVQNLESLISEMTANQAGPGPDAGRMIGFLSNIRNLLQLDLEIGMTRYEGLQSRIFRTINVLYEEANALAGLFSIKRDARIKQIRWGIIFIIILSAFIYGMVLALFSRSISAHLKVLREMAAGLVEGKFPEGNFLKGVDEFSGITEQLSTFILSLKNKAAFAADLANGKEPRPLEALSEDDSLANSLINLGKSLQAARLEEEKHRKLREERRWANEGIAKFGDLLRIHNKDISSLAENVIEELVNYLNACAGGIFLLKTGEEDPEYKPQAGFNPPASFC